MKKRMMAALVSFCCVFSLTACNSKKSDDGNSGKNSEADSQPVSTTESIAETTTVETTIPRDPICEVSGEYVVFGAYEQDGNPDNGPEPIEWKVLGTDETGILLISRYVLETVPYHDEYTGITWENCSLRKWLNGDFMETAFVPEERALIMDTALTNPDGPVYATDGGNDTTDKIYCLSYEEVLQYFEANQFYESRCVLFSQELMAEVTPYTVEKGIYHAELEETEVYHTLGYSSSVFGKDCGEWWLRTPGNRKVYSLNYDNDSAGQLEITEVEGDFSRTAMTVMSNGCIDVEIAEGVHYDFVGVRPVLHLSSTAVPELPQEPQEDTQEGSSGGSVSTENGYVVFGHYEQDGDVSNGPEPIEWIVLSEENGKMLVISRYVLDAHTYHSEYSEVTWETSSLRAWMNSDFYNTAFSSEEQERILTTTISNPDNEYMPVEGGNDTEDKVFCLSVEEARQYFEFNRWEEGATSGNSQALMTGMTLYAESRGAHKQVISSDVYYGNSDIDGLDTVGYTEDIIGQEYASWWLRSPGIYSNTASFVTATGYTGWDCFDRVVDEDHGVRPVMYITVE